MRLTKTERLVLFALGQFYQQLNQPLDHKVLKIRTSKIAFITFLLHSEIITQKSRALYKNLESLEKKKLIEYEGRMIKFTSIGLEILTKINKEVSMFLQLREFFQGKKPKKLQTVLR